MIVSVAGIPRGRAGPFRAISKAVAAGRRTRRIDVTRDSHRIGPERERRTPGGGYFVSRCKAKDRKSVVSGTSVSVRVDLGGSRILKQKKNIICKRHQ